jgi:hypothetical protein
MVERINTLFFTSSVGSNLILPQPHMPLVIRNGTFLGMTGMG